MTDLKHRGELAVGNILEHFGVKGMRWGVRSHDSPVNVELHSNTAGQVKKTAGGQGHPTSVDAKNALTYRQIAKGSGTHALSNQELQSLVKRMNLEQQYSTLTSGQGKFQSGHKTLKSGTGVARDVLATGNTVNEAIKFANSDAGKALRKGLTKKS